MTLKRCSSSQSLLTPLPQPFGHDTDSCRVLTESLSRSWSESALYRIDHYLGKEMVQNLLTLRFSNIFLSSLWSSQYISSVMLTFKEPFGCEGRGGYFDKYGIIRDIIQNHLVQVMTLVAMEVRHCDERRAKRAAKREVSLTSLDDALLLRLGYSQRSLATSREGNSWEGEIFASLRRLLLAPPHARRRFP